MFTYVDPMFTYVGLPNALPHSSDRNGGGDDGVTTGWERGHPKLGRRLGRHASITFGYQPKASGKDTGWAWGRRPDLRATAHAADPWSVPGAGGYRIEFFCPMAIHAFGTHNLLCFWSTSLARRNARTGIESPAPKTVENRCKRCLCQAPAKHSNPSRIRGQAKQNACQKNSFTLPLEPIIYYAFGAQASQDGTREKV